MVTDAAAHGTWILAIGCIVTMPVFGSVAAATYWLLRGGAATIAPAGQSA
jgi:hypothetical protein